MEQTNKMAEQVMRLLNGGDYSVSESKWDIREIELSIQQYGAKLARLRSFEEYAMGEGFSLGQYMATFVGEKIKKDDARGLSYLDLPVKPINLPKNRGVYSIGPIGKESIKYIPVADGFLNFTGVRQAPFLQGNTGYWVEGKKVLFTEDIEGEVIIKLITGDSIVSDLEADIVAQVYQLYSSEKPEDKVIDANANDRQQAQ